MTLRIPILLVLLVLATGCVREAVPTFGEAVVSGRLTYREGELLPDDAVAFVRLFELGESERIVAEATIEPVGASPVPFALRAPSVDTTRAYGVHTSIEDPHGRVLWETRDPVRVLTHGRPAEVDVALIEPERDPWVRARRRGVTFRAVGQEPGWLLDVFGDPPTRLELLADYGEIRRRFAHVERETPTSTRTVYRARDAEYRIRVVVDAVPCTDAMSGEPFEAAVVLTLDGRDLHGCGRAVD